MKSRIVFWLWLFGAFPPFAAAQDPLFWPDVVDTVDVIAPRPFPEETIGRKHGFTQVIPLGTTAPASADLGDLLDRAVGVQVRRYGGLGAVTLASVRGSSPSQVQVAINDTPISTAPDALANLSLLPIRSFDHVELARGPLAVAGGPGAAGVIRLITPDEYEIPPRLRFSVGSFGTTSISATAGIARGSLSLLAAGGRLASEGDYKYLDRRGTPLNISDDEIVRRQNNAFHQEDLLIQARWNASRRVRIETLGHGLWKDAGIPGTESIQTENVHDRFRRWLQSVSIHASDPSILDGKLSAHLQEDVDRYRNLDGEVGLGRADFRNRLSAQGVSLDLGRKSGRLDATLRVRGRVLDETWRPQNLLSDSPDDKRSRHTRDLTAEVSASPVDGRIEFFAEQQWFVTDERFERSADVDVNRSLRTQRLGLSVQPLQGVTLRTGWGEFTRLPSFIELFGQGGIQRGNPELKPEAGEGWDLGAVLRWPSDNTTVRRFGAWLEVVYFETSTDAAIVWLQNSQRTTIAMNLERTRASGTETLLRTRLRQGGDTPALLDPSLFLDVAFTRIDARDDGPSRTYHGKVLPHQPRDRMSVETRIELGVVRVAHFADVESELFRDRYNSDQKRRGPRVIHDLEVSTPVLDGRIDVTLGVRNLTDRQTQDIEGFPVPGRSVFAQLTVTGSVIAKTDRTNLSK